MAQAQVAEQKANEKCKLVTLRIGNQLFGVPVEHVQDVLREQKVAYVPLAQPEILGSINLRGRIVTVINMRRRLGLPPRSDQGRCMFVVVEHNHELYSLQVDAVGDVLDAPVYQIEHHPDNMDPKWGALAQGIWQMKDELLLILDIEATLKL